MVSEDLSTFLCILLLQITSRVANVVHNGLTYNRHSQKIISEMNAQLAIFLPLKEFFSILKFSNVTGSSCKQFRMCSSYFQMVYCSKIASNHSSSDLHQLFWDKKIRIVNHSILSSWKERKFELMVLITVSDRWLICYIPRHLWHEVLDPIIFYSILSCITSYLCYMFGCISYLFSI